MPRTLIAGNWKMNGLRSSLSEVSAVIDALGRAHQAADIALCGPATLVAAMADLAQGSRLKIGGQTCHTQASGAHTGDISAAMLADAGAAFVIVGHSERRADHGEGDSQIANQAAAAMAAGLTPIICVGETLAQRDAGETLAVTARQLEGSLPTSPSQGPFVVAYEPIWAIGTGRTANTEQIAEVHGAIRAQLASQMPETGADVPILYGGSMKPANAREILSVPEVNGGLIGGASLKAADFLAIYEAAG
ncbi:MAG: triose-phosphate isomerase [Pseudomonadota bacterium]